MSATIDIDRDAAAEAVLEWIAIYEEANEVHDRLPVTTRAAIEASGNADDNSAVVALLATMPTSRRDEVLGQLRRILELL